MLKIEMEVISTQPSQCKNILDELSPRLHSIALIDCIVCHDHMQKYPFSNQNSIIMKYCISKDVAQETLRFDT